MALALLALFLFSFAAPVSAAEKFFYSENPNPPAAVKEPPYEGTRKQIEREVFYLNIRYPYQRPDSKGRPPLFMKFSIGNEIQHIIAFRVEKFELKDGRKSFRVKPSFYNAKTGKPEHEMEKLKQHVFHIQPNLHETVSAFAADGSPRELRLELTVVIVTPEQEYRIEESIPLYRGSYS